MSIQEIGGRQGLASVTPRAQTQVFDPQVIPIDPAFSTRVSAVSWIVISLFGDLAQLRSEGFGLHPEDNPLMLRDIDNHNIYALELERK